MPSLWFVMPAHGRLELARICMGQLRRTCDQLEREGIQATAVVVACDDNLDTARSLGFATVERDNQFLSRKFNDGIQVALDPDINPRPADYVVPIGSDDWVDHRLFLDLPNSRTMHGFQTLSVVREDGLELSVAKVGYDGGCGIRVYPRHLMAGLGYRPADEDRYHGCDTSILTNLRSRHEGVIRVVHCPAAPGQIVDWKSPTEQVTPFRAVADRHHGVSMGDPFVALAGMYPAEALGDMRAHYSGRVLVAA